MSDEENTSEYILSSRGSTLESNNEFPCNRFKMPAEYKIRHNKRKLKCRNYSDGSDSGSESDTEDTIKTETAV